MGTSARRWRWVFALAGTLAAPVACGTLEPSAAVEPGADGGDAGGDDGGGPDAAPPDLADAGGACSGDAPWRAVERIPGWAVAATVADKVKTARPSGSDVYIGMPGKSSSEDALVLLHVAANGTSPTDDSALLSAPNGNMGGDETPAPYAGGMGLLWTNDNGGTRQIYGASRMTANDAFVVDGPFKVTGSVSEYVNPQEPWVIGGHVYFAMEGPSADDTEDILVGDLDLDGKQISNARPLAGVNTPSHDDSYPITSGDEKTLYFASTRDTSGDLDMYVAHVDPSGAFQAPVRIGDGGINVPDADERPLWLSPDGCELWFSRETKADGGKTYTAWHATR